jgi:hypothetical protein
LKKLDASQFQSGQDRRVFAVLLHKDVGGSPDFRANPNHFSHDFEFGKSIRRC